jgi:hypothetical protein
LDRHGVKYDKEEAKERLDLVLKGLRRDPAFEKELADFNKKPQKGGGEYDIPIPVKMTKGDFLGSELRWFVNVMGSPYAQVVVKLLFMVLFFLSYLENIPVVGSILSAVLDVMLAGGRILIKSVQKALPPLIGLIPLPYMSMVGIMLAAVFGMLVWPILAIVSFSRQDFTSAIESYIRIVPPPMGDALADAFLDANRTVYKLNEKRKKLTEDIVGGLQTLMGIGKGMGSRVTQGAKTMVSQLKSITSTPAATPTPTAAAPAAAAAPTAAPTPTPTAAPTPTPTPTPTAAPTAPPTAPTAPPTAPTGGRQRFSRKKRRQTKWRTTRRTK